jgi:hypothetical protein
VWTNGTRTLTSGASITASDVWSYATRNLTDATLTAGSLATLSDVQSASTSLASSITSAQTAINANTNSTVNTASTSLAAVINANTTTGTNPQPTIINTNQQGKQPNETIVHFNLEKKNNDPTILSAIKSGYNSNLGDPKKQSNLTQETVSFKQLIQANDALIKKHQTVQQINDNNGRNIESLIESCDDMLREIEKLLCATQQYDTNLKAIKANVTTNIFHPNH